MINDYFTIFLKSTLAGKIALAAQERSQVCPRQHSSYIGECAVITAPSLQFWQSRLTDVTGPGV